jgi:uncharacterized damage-inducible protein DinB
MQPRIRELLDYLDSSHTELTRAIDAVAPADRVRRPAPERWSAADVVEHLALVESRIAGVLLPQLAGAASGGVGPERDASPVVPTMDVVRLTDRGAPLVASEASQPRGERDLPASLRALEEQRAALRAALTAADGLALGEVIVPHPRLGPINLYQWVVFVGAHESRHAAQLREIGQLVAR